MESRLLKADEIEVKVKQVTDKGAIALLYKTARVDMAILDEVYGTENWTVDYKEVKGNLYCGIGVYTDKGIVWKWDCGIESREDGEGNEKKGEASDAFKRAGFKWGIGRELYTAPFIFLNVETENKKLKNPYQKFTVSNIEHESNNIKSVTIIDNKGNVVFGSKSPKKEPIKTNRKEEILNCELDNQSKLAYLIKERFIAQEKVLKALNGEKANNIPKDTFIKLFTDLTNEN